MPRILYFLVVCVAVCFLSCKDEIFYVAGGDSLVDPKVAPRVIYTYPPLNSEGPYREWDAYFYFSTAFVEVRFNKLMDVPSVARSLKVTSSVRTITMDSTNISSTNREIFRAGIYAPYSGFQANIGEILTLSLTQNVADVNGNVLPAGILGTFLPEPRFRVRAVSPRDGELVYPSPSVTVAFAFNSRVNGSILSHIVLRPRPSDMEWAFSQDSLQLYTSVPISAPGQRYELSVDASAADAAGNVIASPFGGGFSAAPFVIEWGGAYDSVNVSLNRSYNFSTTYAVPSANLRDAFHVTPSVPGGYTLMHFAGTAYAEFRPTTEFEPSTAYTVRIDTNLRTEGGAALARAFTFRFRTAPFRIVGSYPSNGSTVVYRATTIMAYANAELASSTVEPAVQIEPTVAGLNVSTSGSSMYIYHSGLAANTRYTVTIGTSLTTKGGAALPAPYAFSFTTGEN